MATRNRYAEIMEQYQQAQPFSFTGYPSSYTGGYDVAQPQAYAAPVNRYADIMAQPARMGRGEAPVDFNPEWTALSDAGKAAFYAGNPFFSKATQLGQNIFGFNKFGMLQNAMEPGFVSRQKLIAQGIDPAQTAAGAFPGGIDAPPSGGFVAVTPQQAEAAEAARQPIRETIRSDQSLSGGNTGGGGGRYSGDNSGLNAGWGSRDAGGFAYGGYVSMQDLQGPNPDGPDDGYAALKDGEYVINDQAVNQYGIELMNLINSGKISKGELLGLLEM